MARCCSSLSRMFISTIYELFWRQSLEVFVVIFGYPARYSHFFSFICTTDNNAVIIEVRSSNKKETCKWIFSLAMQTQRGRHCRKSNALISGYGFEYKWSVHSRGISRQYFNLVHPTDADTHSNLHKNKNHIRSMQAERKASWIYRKKVGSLVLRNVKATNVEHLNCFVKYSRMYDWIDEHEHTKHAKLLYWFKYRSDSL